jgi:putative transposase
MDFVHDALADGRPFRILTVVDQWSRQSPLLEVAARMSGQTVSEALDRVLDGEPRPRSITVDHGTEFQSRALEDWAYRRGVQLDFIRPGKPVENAFIEAFNGRLRDECLNVHQFASLADAKAKINVAARLQSASAAQLARRPDPERVRGAMSGNEGGRGSRRF